MIDELWKNYNNNSTPENREKLILACLPYVKSCAYHLSIYMLPSQDVNDLVSAGIIGLIDALEKYDPAKGASFICYARYRIRGSIMDEVRSMDWVSYSTKEKARKIEKAIQKLHQNGVDNPNEDEIAKAANMSLENYRMALSKINSITLSLLQDALYDDDISNELEDTNGKNPEQTIMTNEREEMLGNAIEKLSEKERLVVTMYYYEEMNMKEIGKTLSISESRVCQIHSSAILKLYARLKANFIEVGL